MSNAVRLGYVALASLVSALVTACGGDDVSATPHADGGADSAVDGAAPDGASPTTDGGTCGSDAQHDISTATPLTVLKDPGNAAIGFGDPSIVYPKGAAAGFMTYTAVGDGSAETRIATSTDQGATWTYLQTIDPIKPISVTTTNMDVCGATTCSGEWVHEVSSLAYDASDPDPSRRYKVVVHSYFIPSASKANHFEIGTIDLLTTAQPGPSATWASTPLFGWNSSSPQSSMNAKWNVTTDATLSPLLGKCIALSEPGVLVRGSTLDLAIGCEQIVSSSSVPIEIKLLRSTDHGLSWSPVSTLLSLADATALGASGTYGPEITAADLFQVGGSTYLFASPNGPVSNLGSGYRGCLAFRFADVDAGTLERCGAVPAVVDTFQGPAGLFNGACTFAEGATASGVVALSLDVTRKVPFQMLSTGVPAP